MQTRFTTNIDCCKNFMGAISGLSIDPHIGDTVRVYHDTQFEIYMKVEERTWRMTNGSSPVLSCYLGLTDGWNIPDFEKMLSDHGFRW